MASSSSSRPRGAILSSPGPEEFNLDQILSQDNTLSHLRQPDFHQLELPFAAGRAQNFTVRDFVEYVRALPPSQRSYAYEKVMTGLTTSYEENALISSAFWKGIKQDQGFINFHGGTEQMEEHFAFFADHVHKRSSERRDELSEVHSFMHRNQPDLSSALLHCLPSFWNSVTGLKRLRTFILINPKGLNEDSAVEFGMLNNRMKFLNMAMFERLRGTSGKGKRQGLQHTSIKASDFSRATQLYKEHVMSNIPPANALYSPTNEERLQWRMLILRNGLWVGNLDFTDKHVVRWAMRPSNNDDPRLSWMTLNSMTVLTSPARSSQGSPMQIDTPSPGGTGWIQPSPRSTMSLSFRVRSSSSVGLPVSPGGPKDVGREPLHSEVLEAARRMLSLPPDTTPTAAQQYVLDPLSVRVPNPLPRPLPESKVPRRSARLASAEDPGLVARTSSYMEEVEDDVSFMNDLGPSYQTTPKTTGSCSCKQISSVSTWVATITRKTKVSEDGVIRLLNKWYEFAGRDPSRVQVCSHHTRACASKIRLQTSGLSIEEVISRMRACYLQKHSLGRLKSQADTYSWFRLDARPPVPGDQLGIYKYMPTVLRFAFGQQKTHIINGLKMQPVINQFCTDSTVNVPIFDWLVNNPKLKAIIDEEFNMYYFHQRRRNGRPNFGWCRTMYHSLVQQAIRTDLHYYTLYVVLRPDEQIAFVSYPYYTKYAQPGENAGIFFRHVDVNIPHAVETGKGLNMIQGSVSLDNEDDKNCTEVIKGFHLKLHGWYKDRQARGKQLSTSRFIHGSEALDYTKEDEKVYGAYEPVPCKAGEVRITFPYVFHGSTGSPTIVRRTVLPWYCGVQDDHGYLEIPEGGTWEQIAAAHRDLLPGPSSPSGKPNAYGEVPYSFPAAVRMRIDNPVSRALVGQCRWDSLEVVDHLHSELFKVVDGGKIDATSWQNAVKAHRSQIKTEMLRCWKLVEKYERKAYGSRSYFHCRDNNLLNSPPTETVQEDTAVDEYQIATSFKPDELAGAGSQYAKTFNRN